MHVILGELATPGNPLIYPMIDINEDILSKSLTYYSNYIKSKFTASYYTLLISILLIVILVIIRINRCCQ